MRKFTTLFLCLVLTIACTLLLTACAGPCKDGHEWGEYTVVKAATCAEAGQETAKCKNCDETTTRDIPKLAHEWGAYTVTTEATCTEKGVETATCKNCSATDTKEIPALGHDFTKSKNHILFWQGSGQNIPYGVLCDRCGAYREPIVSHGNYRTLDKLFDPDPNDANAIKEFYLLVFDYDPQGGPIMTFSVMREGKRMYVGTDENARSVAIDSSASVTGATTSVIEGEITVYNGELIIRGDVDLSGDIIVKDGQKLTIESGATIENTGSIVIEKGGILVNNGTVTGTPIDNKN